MKRWIKRFAIGLASLLLLIFGTVYFLLGTERGTQWLIGKVQQSMPEQLQVGEVDGTLLGRLQLTGIHYQNPSVDVVAGSLLLAWNPSELFSLHVYVDELSAADIQIQSIPGEQEEATSEPVELPELKLPVKITVNKLAVQEVQFVSAPEATAVVVNDVDLALRWDKTGIQLEHLDVNMPQGQMHAEGMVNPVDSYPLQIELDAATASEDLPDLNLVGDITGDLQKLNIKQQLSGDVAASFDFDV